jgi:hypothetical protein
MKRRDYRLAFWPGRTPAPNDLVYLVMRMYWPRTEPPSILPIGKGTWKPPEIKVAN